MKKHSVCTLALILALVAALLAGCGAGSTVSETMAAKNGAVAEDEGMMAAPEAMMADAALSDGTAADRGTGEAPDSGTQLPENRKWIVTVYLDAETEDLDALTAALNEKISGLNGYVEDQNIYNGSSYSDYRYRSANLTIRIPAEVVDQFTAEVAGIANVISNQKNLEDVTLSYTTTENRVLALQTEEARLLELMAQAENMSDLLEIEARLTDVRTELENYGSQLRLYDNQIDYATIHLSIEEVKEFTPVEEPSMPERIRDGFKASLKGVGEGIVDFTVWILANSPYLVVWGVILAVSIPLLRRLHKRRKERKAAKAEKKDS